MERRVRKVGKYGHRVCNTNEQLLSCSITKKGFRLLEIPFLWLSHMPAAGLEPTTHAFRFVLITQLSGLYLRHSLRNRRQPSSLYTFKPTESMLRTSVQSAWLGIAWSKYDTLTSVTNNQPIHCFPDHTTVTGTNAATNLIALCPNHHWEFDNGLVYSLGFSEFDCIHPVAFAAEAQFFRTALFYPFELRGQRFAL